MIFLSNITKTYRAEDIETTALDDITLEIGKGEFVAVMGPSGCGKSSLLNVAGLIDRPKSGRYVLNGHELARFHESEMVKLRKQIGFIFQNFNLIDDLSVHENVELPLLYQGVARAERRSRVREVLELVGLEARAKHRPAQLSGGQQQRVAVARAVVGDPPVILADEPTGNLDTRNGEEVMDMLTTLNEQGATILMVTHSPVHAERASRVVEMLDGRIVDSGLRTGA